MINGTVQTLTCSREGRTLWSKQVYIPSAEQAEAYGRYVAKAVGVFFYDLTGAPRSVSRKPAGVERWND